jgi:hypothetical protein
LTGLALVIGYALLGATWLVLKTEGGLRDKAYRLSWWLLFAMLLYRMNKRSAPASWAGFGTEGITMLFYRGIAVPADEVASTVLDISQNGLQVRSSGWRMIAQDLKRHLNRLWSLPSIERSDVDLVSSDETPHRICACADKTSALFYACKKNVNATDTTSILIAFDADIADVIVDGRDLLYTAFQMGDPDRARPVLKRLFGSAILRYADRAWATDKGDLQRVSICDLAVQDNDIIRAHARNATVIGGRYRTEFCSAFMVRMPIPADQIVAVETVSAKDFSFPEPEVLLQSIV